VGEAWDAVVVGAGHNGLVAANVLADRGWSVLVIESEARPGGAVRSAELMEPGFVNDLCSTFYPLGAVSPALRSLHLERYGLELVHAPAVLAHPTEDGACPLLSRDLDETADSLDAHGRGDGEAWRALYRRWQGVSEPLVASFLSPFPPVRHAVRLALRMPPRDLVRFARFSLLPARRLGEEHFSSGPARRLLAGLGFHADLGPEVPLSGFFGWLMMSLGQQVGFPVARGGAQALTTALVERLLDRGGALRLDSPVTSIEVHADRATGVRTAGGEVVAARRAVLADVDAPRLYGSMLPGSAANRLGDDLERFAWGSATVKVDWNLDGPIPWSADGARRAGTVHVGGDLDDMTQFSAELAMGRIPEKPFLIMGQPSLADPSRQPPGTSTAWAYTHVPRSACAVDEGWLATVVARVEREVEALAPGFGGLVRHRHVTGPSDFTTKDANLSLGSMNGGTAQLHQQLLFRPRPGTGRPETPVRGLYLASASAHPGGGVHGAPGNNAARAALAHGRLDPRVRRRG